MPHNSVTAPCLIYSASLYFSAAQLTLSWYGCREDHWIAAYEEMRMLRALFGSAGTIIVHDTLQEVGSLAGGARQLGRRRSFGSASNLLERGRSYGSASNLLARRSSFSAHLKSASEAPHPTPLVWLCWAVEPGDEFWWESGGEGLGAAAALPHRVRN